jgi:chromosome segregation ATPase
MDSYEMAKAAGCFGVTDELEQAKARIAELERQVELGRQDLVKLNESTLRIAELEAKLADHVRCSNNRMLAEGEAKAKLLDRIEKERSSYVKQIEALENAALDLKAKLAEAQHDLAARVEKVLVLHQKGETPDIMGRFWCQYCDQEEWPCETTRIMNGED